MIDELIKYFEKYVELDNKETNFLQENLEIRKVKKNDLLLVEGDISREFYFVLEGCIRLFYNKDIVEKTAFFYVEKQFVSSYESFVRQIPAKHNFQAIEDSTLVVIEHDIAFKIVELFPKFEFLARIMMEEELIIYQDIIHSFITLTAEERYLKMLRSNSPVIQRVPQHQLATYLGVTAETLSRIRKRISTS